MANLKIDKEKLIKLRSEGNYKLRELAQILDCTPGAISRMLSRMRRAEERKLSLLSGTPSQETIGLIHPPQHRSPQGQYITKRFKRSDTEPSKPAKISNRELFDKYMTEEFIAWIQENEPRSFLDCWTRLQPKDSNINIGGNIDMQVIPYDPRIVEIQALLSYGLGNAEIVRRVREIVGTHQVIECEPVAMLEGVG